MHALDDLGLRDETAVVVFGDHGEELGEHGIYFDHHGLYETIIHVPLVMDVPDCDATPDTVTETVQLVDLAPTVLDLAGIERPAAMDGSSLLPHLQGREASGYSEVLAAECTWMAKWSLRTDSHKVIVAREPDFYGSAPVELYDLADDPGETHNLAKSKPGLAAELSARMEDVLAERLDRAGRDSLTVGPHCRHV